MAVHWIETNFQTPDGYGIWTQVEECHFKSLRRWLDEAGIPYRVYGNQTGRYMKAVP